MTEEQRSKIELALGYARMCCCERDVGRMHIMMLISIIREMETKAK